MFNMFLQEMSAYLLRKIQSVFCWFGYHESDDTRIYEIPDEHLPGEVHLLTYCKHCWEGPFILT